jgi:hypothetical protein
VETKQLLDRGRPPEPAFAVRDEAVHRDAHRVDQHGFELIAPERRTTIPMWFTMKLEIGLLSLCAGCSATADADREAKLIVVGGPSDRTVRPTRGTVTTGRLVRLGLKHGVTEPDAKPLAPDDDTLVFRDVGTGGQQVVLVPLVSLDRSNLEIPAIHLSIGEGG